MNQKRAKAVIFWDESDPQDNGWAWRFNDDSGSIDTAPQIPTAPDYMLKEAFRREVKDSLMIDYEIHR